MRSGMDETSSAPKGSSWSRSSCGFGTGVVAWVGDESVTGEATGSGGASGTNGLETAGVLFGEDEPHPQRLNDRDEPIDEAISTVLGRGAAMIGLRGVCRKNGAPVVRDDVVEI